MIQQIYELVKPLKFTFEGDRLVKIGKDSEQESNYHSELLLESLLYEKPLDIAYDLNGTPFQIAVWDLISQIPRGEVRTYKELAILLHNAKAARAVANACGANPLPILIPCHRVVRSDNHLGGYSLGIEYKQALLELERGDSNFQFITD